MNNNDIKKDISAFEKKLGYTFKDKSLVLTAITHSSYANEHQLAKKYCNERLEFLGDALVDMIAGEYLFINLSESQEGVLSKKRAAVVCEQSFASIGEKIELGQNLLLGKGEEATGGRHRASIIADAFEAVIAAIYLDSDFETAKKWVLSKLTESLEEACKSESSGDFKSGLQEMVQKGDTGKVSYESVGESGPEHAKIFEVCVLIDGKRIASGKGTSKKDAEQAAAAEAMRKIKEGK